MGVQEIIVAIDLEMRRLKQARDLLEKIDTPASKQKATYKAKTGTVVTQATDVPAKTTMKKGAITAEGRRRISEAMKLRWAKKRKQAASKAA